MCSSGLTSTGHPRPTLVRSPAFLLRPPRRSTEPRLGPRAHYYAWPWLPLLLCRHCRQVSKFQKGAAKRVVYGVRRSGKLAKNARPRQVWRLNLRKDRERRTLNVVTQRGIWLTDGCLTGLIARRAYAWPRPRVRRASDSTGFRRNVALCGNTR